MNRGIVVVTAGLSVNLCLGVLYAWSVWKKFLKSDATHPAGSAMAEPNLGWEFLSDAESTWGYAVCGLTFALTMIPGGRLQDRHGPRPGAFLAGLFIAAGCLVAGFLQSVFGLFLGFGLLCGIGMGLGYSASTPAAVQWFSQKRRGLIVGIVVGGYGAASIYIAPLASKLIQRHGISGSFAILGILFGSVIVVASLFLRRPPEEVTTNLKKSGTMVKMNADWTTAEMVGTRQFWFLLFLFLAGAQAGLLVIADAAPILSKTAGGGFLATNDWLLPAYGGFMNALGRVVTGFYSDRIGRRNAFAANGLVCAVGLIWIPTIIDNNDVMLLFALVGLTLWQYGGCLSLLPAMTADYFGSKHMGLNYGLVFLGWGAAFLMPQAAAILRDATQQTDLPFYFSALLLAAGVVLSRFISRPNKNKS